MIQIISHIGTDQVKSRFEECTRAGGYQVKEWLVPGHNGKGLRVAAVMRIKGRPHGLGFKWNGEDINELAQRCIALDYAMQKLPMMVAQGKVAPWEDN